MKKFVIILAFVLLAGGVYANRGTISDWFTEAQKPNVPEVAFEDVAETEEEGGVDVPVVVETDEEPLVDEPVVEPVPEEEPEAEPVASALPAEFNLAVPFTSQAPHSNWAEPYNEACEEASALMAAYYLMGKPSGKIDPSVADAELLKIVEFENQLFGFYKDTTAEETALLIESFYHLSTELLENPTIEQIKSALNDGYPVIVPAAGRQLGNPNFTGAGPLYHMFVLKGYTENGFITNDPGTRLGADYFYTYETVMSAMHDWNGGEVETGAKVVIIVKP